MSTVRSEERPDPGGSDLDRENPKVQQIIAAGRRLFLDQPYAAVSMDQIARAAGVSKATLYAHFASKEQLFGALISAECGTVARQAWDAVDADLDIETLLLRFGHDFVETLIATDSLALYRIMIAESPRFPDLGRNFFASGPLVLRQKLAEFLRAADARGDLRIPDPDLAATQLLSLVEGDIPLRCLVAEESVPDSYKRALVKGGVALFLAAYRAKPLERAAMPQA